MLLASPPTLADAGAQRPTDTSIVARDRFWLHPRLHPLAAKVLVGSPLLPSPRDPLGASSLSSGAPVASISVQFRLPSARLAWLADHRVMGAPLLPAAAMLEMAVAAASTALGDFTAVAAPAVTEAAGGSSGGGRTTSSPSSWCVSGLSIMRPVVMPSASGDNVTVTCTLLLSQGTVELLSTSSGDEGRTTSVAKGAISCIAERSYLQGTPDPAVEDSVTFRRRLLSRAAIALGISAFASAAMCIGPHPNAVEGSPRAAAAPAPSIGGLCATPAAGGAGSGSGAGGCWYTDGFHTFPGHLDSALHLGVAAPGSGAKVPVAAGAYLSGPSVYAAHNIDDGDDAIWAVMASADSQSSGSDSPEARKPRRGRSSFFMVAGGSQSRHAVLQDLETVTMAKQRPQPLSGASIEGSKAARLHAPSLSSGPNDGQQQQQVAYEVQMLVSEPAGDADATPGEGGRPAFSVTARSSAAASAASVLQLIQGTRGGRDIAAVIPFGSQSVDAAGE